MVILQKLKALLPSPLSGAYHIGFCRSNMVVFNQREWYKNVQWVNTWKFDKEGWFADPFFLSVDENKIELLAEEFVYADGKGRLVKMIIDRKSYELTAVSVVLETNTHLSFPAIFREDGKIYVYPENSASGGQFIYEYDEKNSVLINPFLLVSQKLIDSQLIKIDGSYFLFAVELKEGWWEETRYLKIFKSSSLCGKYREVQTIINERNEERGAGLIDNMIRPVQCCEGAYGKETILYKLIYENGLFSEIEVGRILPNTSHKYGNVLHTYNEQAGLTVIDGYADNYPIMKKIYKMIRGIKQ